jgi:hypothetical protein
MKKIIVSLSIFVIMIIGMIFSIQYLNKVCKDLEGINSSIEIYINEGNMNKAYETSLELTKKWKKYSESISIFVNHQEIDNIETELAKIPQYIKEDSKEESLASVRVLTFFLNHVKKLEKINIQNIF